MARRLLASAWVIGFGLLAGCQPGELSVGGGGGIGEDVEPGESGHEPDYSLGSLSVGAGLTLGGALLGLGDYDSDDVSEGDGDAGGGAPTLTLTGAPGLQPGGSGAPPAPPASTAPTAPPALVPASTPASVAPVCGPDITPQVESVLTRMTQDFRSWSLTERASRCTALYAPTSFNVAWDILQLSPRVTPLNDNPATADDESSWPSWFERISPNCARPREPCGPTVAFHGMCVHSQILNYMQWGLMNRLCGGGRAQDWTLIDWDAAATGSARARTLVNGLSSGNAAAAAAIAEEQIVFTELGARYADIADTTLEARSDFYTDADEGVDIRALQATYTAALAGAIRQLAAMTGRAITACTLACRLTGSEQATLDAMQFGYIWGDFRFEGAGDPWFAGGQAGGRRGTPTVNVLPGTTPPPAPARR